MDAVSNVDQLVQALRRRLLERSTAVGRQQRQRSETDGGAGGLDSVYALARINGVDDHQLGRALIQSILTDQFGAKLINEAKFQQVVDRVVETLETDDAASKLLFGIVTELRAAAS